jgi:Ser/Thr protein kinase RdoA (MazF antagonist)
VIDFDLARPTSRLADLVITLRYWAPLADPVDRDPVLVEADAGARMRVFADAYGLSDGERARLLDLADVRIARSWHLMKGRAERDGGGWARMWDEGVGDRLRRAHDWLRRERATLATQLDR